MSAVRSEVLAARPVRGIARARFGLGPALAFLVPFWLGALPGLGRPLETSEPTQPPVPICVDLNRAGWAELMLLPGMGEVRARDIVRFRERRGAFRSVEDLDEVPGIGSRSVERFWPLVHIDGEPNHTGRHESHDDRHGR